MNKTDRIIAFCYSTHPELLGTLPEWKLRDTLERYKKNIAVQNNGNGIEGVSIFLRVSDKAFESIVNGKTEFKDVDDLFLFTPLGENIIFLGLVAKGYKTIRNGLRDIVKSENPGSIAWYRDNKKKFFIVRRK